VPQPFLGPPFRAFPSQESRTPLEATLLPCSYPPACHNALLSPYHRRFHPLPRFHAVAWIPCRLWTPFSRTRRSASRSPWTRAMKPSLTASFTCFEALLPLRIRSQSTRVAPRRRPMLSWAYAPLECSPDTLRILRPAQARRPKHAPSPEGSSAATQRTSKTPKDPFDPSGRVRPPKIHECTKGTSSADSSPGVGPARTTSRRPLLLP